MKEYYKVVTNERKSFYVKEKWELDYPVGKEVKAKDGTMLFIFDSYKAAFDFLNLCSGLIIKVKPIGKLYKPIIRPTNISDSYINRFWDNFNKFKYYSKKKKAEWLNNYMYDSHTVLCKSVKVLT